jgi:uncharacterized membrane protein YidH (DUF202 family)
MGTTEGAAGLSTTAIAWCIDGWDEQRTGDGQTEKARAQLAALVEAAGRAGALVPAVALADIDRALADLGVATTPTIVPDERRRAAAETVRTFLRVLRTAVAAVDAGGGAVGARDETTLADSAAGYAVAERGVILAAGAVWHAWRAFDAALQTRDWAGHDKRKGDYYAALDALGAALDALRAGGAGEGSEDDG